MDVEGSGQGVTLITSEADYTIFASSDAELRDLRVSNRTTTPQSNNGFDPRWSTILVEPGDSARLTDVTVNSEGTAYGVRVLENGSARLRDVTVELDGTTSNAHVGVSVVSDATVVVTGGSVILHQFGFAVDVAGEATLKNTTILVRDFLSNGVRVFAGTVTLEGATVDAGDDASAIVAAFGGTTVNVHHSVLIGRLSIGTPGGATAIAVGSSQVVNPGNAGAQCVASYSADFSPVDANCQPIP